MMDTVDQPMLERLAYMALANLGREYPNHIQHLLDGEADVLSPRALHPVFFGAYDWHSSVHNYWMLVRLLKLVPEASFAHHAREFIARHLTPEGVEQECRYFADPRRASFERPYGLAWLLQLAAELAEWGSLEAREWQRTLAPLEAVAVARFHTWLPKLGYPIRSGEHSQSAFAFGLVLDWARATQDAPLRRLVEAKSREFHLHDAHAPLDYEPSGQDFMSPVLAEADLMRRVLQRTEFAHWLAAYLPRIPADGGPWLPPASTRDPADPKLAHIDGLNLSRAWMLEGIASALPPGDVRRSSLMATSAWHAQAGLAAIKEEHYEGSHWLPSFAVYLLTKRGLRT